MATAETKTFRPEQIAKSLGIPGKQVRAYLRKEFPRKPEERNTSWVLTKAQAQATVKHFKDRTKDES